MTAAGATRAGAEARAAEAEVVASQRSQLAATRRTLVIRATMFAAVASGAALLLWLQYGPPAGNAAKTAAALLVAAAPLSAAAAGRARSVARLALAASALLVLVHALWLASILGTERSAWIDAFSGFGLWPFVVLAVAAGRAADDLAALPMLRPDKSLALLDWLIASGEGDRLARTLTGTALYAAGVAVLLFSLAFAGAGAAGEPGAVAWLLETPVHAALVVLSAAVAVLLVAAMAETTPAPYGIAGAAPPDPAWMEAAALGRRARRRFVRTLIALLPVLGFLGTVLGIMTALEALPSALVVPADGAQGVAPQFARSLGGIATAFETTLIGLVASFAFSLWLAAVERSEAEREADSLYRAATPAP